MDKFFYNIEPKLDGPEQFMSLIPLPWHVQNYGFMIS